MLKTELEKLLDKCLLPSEEKSLQDPAVRSYSQLASNHHPHHPLPNLLWQLGPERDQPQRCSRPITKALLYLPLHTSML